MALRRVLQAASSYEVPEDDAVVTYCDDVITGFLESGCIDGEPAQGPEDLYTALQPFADPEEEIG